MKTIAFVLVAAAAASANAGFVDMKFLGTGEGSSVRISHFGNQRNVFAGQLRHQIANGTGSEAALNGDHRTFCADIAQYVSSSFTPYEVVEIEQVSNVSPMGNVKAGAIRAIYTAAGSSAIASNATASLAAAFQLAVWEIVTDYNGTAGSLSITAGDFRATKTDGSSLSATVLGHLTTLFAAATSSNEGSPQLAGLRSGSAQDQLVMGFSIPTPGTAVLAGFGVLCLGRRRR
ncbi:MAG: hypothetical protein HEQ23_00150 [Tepidisphaera sp.]